MRAALACAVLPFLVPPALAAESGTERWIKAQNWVPLRVVDIGSFDPEGNEMIGVDSLTYSLASDWPWLTVPDGPARFVAFFDDQVVGVSKAALVFDDATPACGTEVGTMPVDSGTGAFLDRKTAQKLDLLSGVMGPFCNLYDCLMAKQVADYAFAQLIRLPDGSSYPAFSSGYGDGVYPVVALYDVDGAIVAAYVDFMGRNEAGEWLLPKPCTPDTSDPKGQSPAP
jgi:hypothetical protein